MSIARSLRTFVYIFRRQPSHAWELLQLRVEDKLGIPVYFLSIRRLWTYIFELTRTRKVSSNLTAYGNYYLDQRLLGERPVVFSAGVGQEIAFDRALIERHKVELYLFDPTPTSKRYIESLGLPANVRFEAIALADYDGDIELFIDDVETDFESTASISVVNRGFQTTGFKVPCRRLKTLLDERGIQSLDVLKLDIEGAAIRVLIDAFGDGIFPAQIAAEFERPEKLRDVRAYLQQLAALFEQLKAHGYDIYRTRDAAKGCQVEILAVRDRGAAG